MAFYQAILEKVLETLQKILPLFMEHITKIRNIDFLNLKDCKDNKYYSQKIVVRKKDRKRQLLISEVTDNIEDRLIGRAKLRTFIAKLKDLSFFYYKKEKKKYNKD